jgi:hypothetical protein
MAHPETRPGLCILGKLHFERLWRAVLTDLPAAVFRSSNSRADGAPRGMKMYITTPSGAGIHLSLLWNLER